MSKELFSVYHCKACNKIEVSQYISREQMEELGYSGTFRGRRPYKGLVPGGHGRLSHGLGQGNRHEP